MPVERRKFTERDNFLIIGSLGAGKKVNGEAEPRPPPLNCGTALTLCPQGGRAELRKQETGITLVFRLPGKG